MAWPRDSLLVEAFSQTCECCRGRGIIVHDEPLTGKGSNASTSDARSAPSRPGDGGSGLTYNVFQDEYALADDFLVPVNTTRFTFLNPAAHRFWRDYDRIAHDAASMLRLEVGAIRTTRS